MKFILAVFAVYILGAPSAFASFGIRCKIDDHNLRLDFSAGLSGGNGSLYDVKGEATLNPGRPSKAQRPFTIDKDTLSQHWLDAKDLRLKIRKADMTPPFSTTEIIIMTQRRDEDYDGSYELTLAQKTLREPIKLSGKVKCIIG